MKDNTNPTRDPTSAGLKLVKSIDVLRLKDYDHDLCETLIENGADLTVKGSTGLTALSAASVNGLTDLAKIMLDKGADIEAQSPNGSTPLMLAILNNHPDTVGMLIRQGANLHARNNDSNTPLMYAANRGNAQIVRMLLDKNVNLDDKNIYGNTAADFASWSNDKNILHIIEKEPARRTAHAFRAAAEKGTARARKIKRPAPNKPS